MKKKLLLLCLLFVAFIQTNSFAQWTYSVTQTIDGGNPGGLNTDTDNASASVNGWTGLISGSAMANTWSASYTLPFAFDFYGTPVTDAIISGNGVLSFTTTATAIPADANTTLPATGTSNIPDNSILGYWDSFSPAPPLGPNDSVEYKVFGTAPNRQVWFRYFSYEYGDDGSGGVASSFTYWSIVLEETTNKVYVVGMYENGGSSLSATVGVQKNSTTAVEFGAGLETMNSGLGITDNDYYEFTPILLVNDNAAIASIDAPVSPLSVGSQNVDVTLENAGLNTLTSATINWAVNGVTQTANSWTGSLAPNATATVSLGTYNFLAGNSTINAWSTLPNGITDGDPSNDSIAVTLCTSLNGTYTVGGASPDYIDITSAAADLNSCGVDGPVVFNIAAGTYTDSVYLGNIVGSSATNTVSFIGADAFTTILTYDGSNTQPTWQMEGTNNIIIKNLTIETTKTSADAWGIHMSQGVNEVLIDSCRFITPVTTTTDIMGIVASNSLTTEATVGNNVDNLTVTNSYFIGGESGIHIEGATAFSTGFNFSNNEFNDHDDQAIEMDNVENVIIRGNTIEYTGTNTLADGIYLVDANDYHVDANTISVSDWGIYVNDGNDGFTPTNRSSINNNIVISSSDGAIELLDFESTTIYHNTTTGNPAFTMNDQVDVDIRNNIFYGDGNVSFFSTDALTVTDTVDYNIYSSTVSPFSISGTTYADLPAWIVASSVYNANSIEAIPDFISATDLHMDNDVNAFNNGVDLGILTDVDGDVRPQDGGFDIGADEFNVALPSIDVAVASLVEPVSPFCPGMSNIRVVINNFGLTTIDSVNLTLSLTGATTTTLNLGGLNVVSLGSDTINLGQFLFNAGTLYDITVSSANPNGMVDGITTNDTLMVTGLSASMTGTYTINSAIATGGTNFQTFGEATNSLNSSGVCGPVVFNVAAGTYTDSVYLGNIVGSSATNTISFVGADAFTTIVTYDGSNTQPTWQMEGTNNIIIKNLTIETTKTSADAWGIHMSQGVNEVLIDSCRFITPVTTTTDIMGIVASNSLTSETTAGDNVDNLTVTNSYFIGGESGIHIEGATAFSTGFNFSNNEFNDHDDQAIEMDNVENVIIRDNTIEYTGTNTTTDGVYLVDANDYHVDANTISVSDWGIYVNDGNDGFTPTNRSSINNNIVISSSDGAIELNDFESTTVYHNTTTGNPAFSMNDQVDVDIRNNIFYGDGNVSFFSTDALTATDTVDYNIYSSTVSPFSISGTTYADLPAWIVASSVYNANSIEAIPDFISATDLHMDNDVNAYNNGVDVGILTDVDGDVRPQGGGFDIGADEFILVLPSIDVAVASLVEPVSPFCPGMSNIRVVINNFGSTTIDSVNLTLSLTGATTTTLNLGGLNVVSLGSDTINLGQFLFNAGTLYDITVSSANPNGMVDGITTNDTLMVTGLGTSLTGTYTINSAIATGGANFQTFGEATNSLNSFGVCGPVVFNIAAGTYTDSVYLGNIVGSSATNTVSLIGADAFTTILTYDGSNTQPTWQMEGTNNIIIKNLTIETTKTSADAWGIHMSQGVNEVLIDSCRFITPVTTTTDIMGIVASNSLTTETTAGVNVDNLTVTNSYFIGGESGIHIEGATAFSTGFNFSNNEFNDHDDQAIEMDNVENVIIRDNTIEYTGTNTTTDGVYLVDANDYHVDANTISVSDWGIYVNDGNDGFTPNNRSSINNNIVISSSDGAIELNDFESTTVYHNTTTGNPAFSMNDQVDVDIRNNIFYGDGNVSFFSTDALTVTDTVDYNIYSSTVSPFSISGTTYADLPAWIAASSVYNANSIEAIPTFVSATDLHMGNDLNAYNNGLDIGVTTDIDGDARPQDGGFDIGADEFSLPVSDVGVSTLVGGTTGICEDTDSYFTFVITNYSLLVEDTIPYSFNLIGANSISSIDTSFAIIPAIGSTNVTVGPFNTVGMGASVLTINTNLTGDNDSSNDSLILNLAIGAPSTGTDVQTACDSYTWIDGITYTASNSVATFVLQNASGCDSTVTLDLTINSSSTGTDVQTACDSYTWIDGITYTASNSTATFVVPNAAGCDSTVTLDLTINNSNAATDGHTSCGPFTWIDGVTYTSSNNTATFTLTNAAGCDSVVSLYLVIASPSTGTDVQTACGSYTWIDGMTYTSSNNTATYTLNNSNGCDSVITLDLTINMPTTNTITVTDCQLYTSAAGNTYTSTGMYTETFIGANGCDSILTIDLTITNPSNSVSLSNNIFLTSNQAGATYQWLDCGNGNAPIAGATNQVYVATTNGDYSCEVTLGSCTVTSECITVSTVGFDEADVSFASVYPNPVNSLLTITLSDLDNAQFELMDVQGKIVISSITINSGDNVNVSNLESGIYFVRLTSDDNRMVKRIVKH